MASKIEWAAQIKAAGIALPENWGKLSTSRAEVWKRKALGEPEPVASAMGKVSAMAAGVAAATGAVASAMTEFTKAAAAMLGVPEGAVSYTPGKEAIPGEVYYNPNWKRSGSGGGRGWYPVRTFATAPDPMTRQVARQLMRRRGKMPLGISQAKWHDLMGYGKIGPGRRRASA